jgi:cysteine-rich repeat protein
MGIKQCDDGNTEDGDGCSSRCVVEEGWECEGGSALTKDVCIDVVPPTMQITRNKNNTLLTIKFNEGVIFSGVSDNITAEFINYINVKIIKANKDEVIIPWDLKEIPIFSQFKEFKIHPIINFTTSGNEVEFISRN